MTTLSVFSQKFHKYIHFGHKSDAGPLDSELGSQFFGLSNISTNVFYGVLKAVAGLRFALKTIARPILRWVGQLNPTIRSTSVEQGAIAYLPPSVSVTVIGLKALPSASNLSPSSLSAAFARSSRYAPLSGALLMTLYFRAISAVCL